MTPKTSSLSTIPRTLLPMLPGDEEERRYFSFFCTRTAPVFFGYYESSFWDRLMLQISHAEPAVHHAVVALASLHEMFNGSTEHRPGSDQYALKQYSKSLAGLNRYMSTAKEKSVNVVLICCVLFITFENLRGDYDTAWQHIQGGLKILSRSRQDPRSSKFIHEDIMPVFVRHHVQVKSVVSSHLILDDHAPGDACVPKTFSGLGEARNTFYSLMSLIIDFCWVQVPDFEKCEVQSEKQAAFVRKAFYASLLEQWQSGFDGFLSQLGTSMDSKGFSGAILLQIHHTTLATLLDHSLTVLQCNFDRFLPQFQKIVSLAKTLIEATEETGSSPGKIPLWVDMGIVAPLFYVATRCRDPFLRREAARLISSPRREGPWDAQAAATIAKRVIAIEEERLPQVNVAQDVPESSRVYALRLSQMDLVAHQVKVVFYQSATKLGGDTYTIEETLTDFSASYP
ncbi:hypothetical protein MMC22_005203 [Lobaria immixta]|nr:hypothetical protein [Lobaria immixta]